MPDLMSLWFSAFVSVSARWALFRDDYTDRSGSGTASADFIIVTADDTQSRAGSTTASVTHNHKILTNIPVS